MKVAEKTRKEIEEKFVKMGDYVKIDYLSSCLKNNIDFDTRKFVLVKLSGLYENKKMFLEAGKMMKAAAEINTTYQAKVDDFVKAAGLFIQGSHFDDADGAVKGAFSVANDSQKNVVNTKIKEFYKTQAEVHIRNDRRSLALRTYEKMLTLNLNEIERRETNEKLLGLYDKLGKIRDFYTLKRNLQ